MRLSAQDIGRRLERAYRLRFSRGIYALGRTEYYDFRVEPESKDGRLLSLTIVFKRGERYCCTDPGCHFGFWAKRDWELLRNEFAAAGLEGLGPLRLSKVRLLVEEGAEMGLRFPGDRSELRSSEACSCELGPYDESDPEPEPESELEPDA